MRAFVLCLLGTCAALSVEKPGDAELQAGWHYGCFHQDSTRLLTYPQRLADEADRLYREALTEHYDAWTKHWKEQERLRKQFEDAYNNWLNASNPTAPALDPTQNLYSRWQPMLQPYFDTSGQLAQELMAKAANARNATEMDEGYTGCPECRPSVILNHTTRQLLVDPFAKCLKANYGMFADDSICYMRSVDFTMNTCGPACAANSTADDCTRCPFQRLRNDYTCYALARGISRHCANCYSDLDVYIMDVAVPRCTTPWAGFNPASAGKDCEDALKQVEKHQEKCLPNDSR